MNPAFAKASLNELVEVLRVRYQAASDISPERVPELKKSHLSLTGFSDRNLVEKICQDEIMIDILLEFVRQNISVIHKNSVDEIIKAISSIDK